MDDMTKNVLTLDGESFLMRVWKPGGPGKPKI